MLLEQLKLKVTSIKNIIDQVIFGKVSKAVSKELVEISKGYTQCSLELNSLHEISKETISALASQHSDLKKAIDDGNDTPDMLVSLQHMAERLTKAEEASVIGIAEQVEISSQLAKGLEEKRDELIKSLYEYGDFQYKGRIRHGLQKERKELPQIDENEDLKKNLNITPSSKTIGELKPTQKDFDENKVLAMIAGGFKRPNEYVISKDGYLLDGHHRWAASLETLGEHQSVPVYEVDMNMDELIKYFNKSEDPIVKADVDHFVVGMLSNIEGQLLFVRRHMDDSFHPSEWNLPGGHIDPGETADQAIVREFEEETNLKVEEYFEAKVINAPGAMIHYYWVMCDETKPLALLDGESDNALWLSKEQWQEIDLLLDLKEHLNQILTPDYIKKAFTVDLGFGFEAEASFEKGMPAQKHKGKVPVKKVVVKKGKPFLQTYWVTPEEQEAMSFAKHPEHGELLQSKLPKDADKGEEEEVIEDVDKDMNEQVTKLAQTAMKMKKPLIFDMPDEGLKEFHIVKINEENKTINAKSGNSMIMMPFAAVWSMMQEKKKKVTSKSKSEHIVEDDKYKVIKQLGGSTGAVLVEDQDGMKFVRKSAASTHHRKSEFLALELYKLMDVPVPNVKASKDYNYTSFVEGPSLAEWRMGKTDDDIKKMHNVIAKHFAADALLGNWDVIGLEADNIIIDKTSGVPVRVDVGGSLEYRAMGKKKKKEEFGPKVDEIDSLRDDKINPLTAEVFGDVSDALLVTQVGKLPKKFPGYIPSSIRPTLNKRLKNLQERFEGIPTNLKEMKLFPLDKSAKKPVKDLYKKLEKFMEFTPKDQKFINEMVDDGMNQISVLNYMKTDESAEKHMGLSESKKEAYIDTIGISHRELLAARYYTGNSFESINAVLSEAVGTPTSNIVEEGKVVMTKGPKGEKFFTANEMMFHILQDGAKTIGQHVKDGLYNVQKVDNLHKLRKANKAILEAKESDAGEKHMAAYYKEQSEVLLKDFNKKKEPTEVDQYHPSKEVQSKLVEIKDMGLAKNPIKVDSMINQWAKKTATEYLMIAKLATRALAKAEQFKGDHKYIKSGMVSRKISIHGEENNKLFRDQHQPGNNVIWPRFSSTSTSFGTWSGNIKVKVAIKNSLYVDPISHHQGEQEVLMKPFSRLKVAKWDDDFGSSLTLEHKL